MHEFERSQAQNDVHGNGVLRRRCWAAAEFGPSWTSAMPDSLRSPTLARQVEQRAEALPLSAILISICDLCPSIVAISDFCTGGRATQRPYFLPPARLYRSVSTGTDAQKVASGRTL